ncbi:MAG: hypothetical protein ACRCY8_17705, partial [Dermatophilaceae bacterium]
MDAVRSPRVVVPAGSGDDRATMLQARVDRWWPDLTAGLSLLYPDDAERVGSALLDLVTAAFVA